MSCKIFLSDGVRRCIIDRIAFYRRLAGSEDCPWIEDTRAEIARRIACYKILLNAWEAGNERDDI